MKHPNTELLEKVYTDFAKGDFAAALSALPAQMTFQISGKSLLAGKYDKSSFLTGYLTKLKELSGGTFQLEVHDILASDRHATVLVTSRLTRAGKPVELRGVHVWRFEKGQAVAWYEYPRDLYQFDAIWA
jgi:ketosteroid isomerase-like protein